MPPVDLTPRPACERSRDLTCCATPATDRARVYASPASDDHFVPDIVSLVLGSAGPDAAGECAFGLIGHGAAPYLGPGIRLSV